jgi:hypothetical protein
MRIEIDVREESTEGQHEGKLEDIELLTGFLLPFVPT